MYMTAAHKANPQPLLCSFCNSEATCRHVVPSTIAPRSEKDFASLVTAHFPCVLFGKYLHTNTTRFIQLFQNTLKKNYHVYEISFHFSCFGGT